MRIHNLYEDEHGESHWRDIEVEWTEQTPGGPQSWGNGDGNGNGIVASEGGEYLTLNSRARYLS